MTSESSKDIIIVGGIPCYTLEKAAEILDLHKNTLRQDYIKTGRIRAVKHKRRWWISQKAIEDMFLNPAPVEHQHSGQYKAESEHE